MQLQQFEKGNDGVLICNEDSYDFLLDHFLEKSDLAHVEKISDNALMKYPYSGLILVKYCDALIILDNPTKALSIIEDNKSLVDEFIYLYIICRAAIHMDNFKLANDYFPKIKDASPSNGELYTFIHTLSLCLIDKNNFKDAVKFLQTLNDLDVLDSEHFHDLAFCYDRLF